MKLFSISILMVTMITYADVPYSIVYVHLGPVLPPYLFDALGQARLFNKEVPICLIANEQAISIQAKAFSEINQINLVLCEVLQRSTAHDLFSRQTTLNNQFRDGFWRKACERFFYLHEYMVQYRVNKVCHLESDNLLYVDIAEIFPILESYKGIGAVFDHDERCIPSFMYIASIEAMTDLVQFIAHHASRGMTDMQIIAYYKKERGEYVEHLPIITKEYVTQYSLRSSRGDEPRDMAAYYHNSDRFRSIFDGAALGQYLGGIDPRNGVSLPGFVNETCVFNPSHLEVRWQKDSKGRNIPYAVFKDGSYRINNLHIHSKQLHKFIS